MQELTKSSTQGRAAQRNRQGSKAKITTVTKIMKLYTKRQLANAGGEGTPATKDNGKYVNEEDVAQD